MVKHLLRLRRWHGRGLAQPWISLCSGCPSMAILRSCGLDAFHAPRSGTRIRARSSSPPPQRRRRLDAAVRGARTDDEAGHPDPRTGSTRSPTTPINCAGTPRSGARTP